MYATLEDLKARYGEAELLQLADRDDDGETDPEVVADALADAASLIDSYLAERYSLPLSSVPSSLTRVAAAIARYHLFTDAPTEAAETGYKNAMSWLRDVAAGKARLDAAGAAPISAPGEPQAEAPGRIFTDATLKGFVNGWR